MKRIVEIDGAPSPGNSIQWNGTSFVPASAGGAKSGTVTANLSTAKREHEETIVESGITSSMKILLSLAPHVDTDENSDDMLDIVSMSATPGTGSIAVRLSFSEPTSGPIKLNYIGV